jgi:hypothetical protein
VYGSVGPRRFGSTKLGNNVSAVIGGLVDEYITVVPFLIVDSRFGKTCKAGGWPMSNDSGPDDECFALHFYSNWTEYRGTASSDLKNTS